MTLSVKKAVLWRREIDNRAGTLAESLKSLAKAGVNLQVVMGYTAKGNGSSAVEVYPITDSKAEHAAKEAGLHPAHDVHGVVVTGSDRAGIVHEMANAIATGGINLHFAICQSIENKFHAIFGVGSESDADKAVSVLSKL